MGFLRRLFGADRPPEIIGPKGRVYARADCPYCGVVFDPLPQAKKRCPDCGRHVYVRSGPLSDPRIHLLREEDLAAFDARIRDETTAGAEAYAAERYEAGYKEFKRTGRWPED